MDLKQYLLNFFSKRKLEKSISLFSFWDKHTILAKDIYLGFSARLYKCTIGRYTRIKPGCVLKNVSVGNFCSIANDVMIGVGQHPTNLISTNSIFYKKGINGKFAKHIEYNEEPKTVIGNDVWIGNGALVMDGVYVGDGTIIAARAVVTKNTPPVFHCWGCSC